MNDIWEFFSHIMNKTKEETKQDERFKEVLKCAQNNSISFKEINEELLKDFSNAITDYKNSEELNEDIKREYTYILGRLNLCLESETELPFIKDGYLFNVYEFVRELDMKFIENMLKNKL